MLRATGLEGILYGGEEEADRPHQVAKWPLHFLVVPLLLAKHLVMFLRWILFWTVQSQEEWSYVGEKRRYCGDGGI
jgi:hypothetical protein